MGFPMPQMVKIMVFPNSSVMAESEEELKSLLMKVQEESGKSELKAQHSGN